MNKRIGKNKSLSRKLKILLSVLGCAAICVAVGYAIANASPGANDGPPDSNNSTGPADRVEVVYFHRTNRCSGCIHEEELTRYTLERYFADELASKRVTFEAINYQDKANTAIVDKYGAWGRQLFINTVKDDADHIEEATDLYPLIFNDEAFVETLKGKIEKSLNGET